MKCNLKIFRDRSWVDVRCERSGSLRVFPSFKKAGEYAVQVEKCIRYSTTRID